MRRTPLPVQESRPAAFIGIDPGASGAACLICPGEGITEFIDYDKDLDAMVTNTWTWFGSYNIRLVVKEKVSAMPKQGVKSMFSFGRNVGHWDALIAMARWPVLELTPQAWQKGLVTKTDGVDSKDRVLNVALKLFPHLRDRLYGPKGGKLDGRADALLMAYVAQQRAL